MLRQLGQDLGVPAAALDTLLQEHAALPLGHVAAGIDRRGQDFLSIYLGVRTLPA